MAARPALALLALAGLAAPAHAGIGTGFVTLTASATTVHVGDTFTIGVALSDDLADPSVWGYNVLVTGSGAAFSTVAGSLVFDPTLFPDFQSGQVTPDGAWGFGSAADLLGPSLEPALDDLTVFTFQVLATQGGVIHFDPAEGPGSLEPIETYVPGIVLQPAPYGQVVLTGVSVNVIPTPPTLAAVLLAAPLAARRRRPPR